MLNILIILILSNYIFLNIADNIFGCPLHVLFFLIVSSKLLIYLHSKPFSLKKLIKFSYILVVGKE